jgi:hypothetical protein
VVAAGRNQLALNALHDLGADATISLVLSATELGDAFLREAGQTGFQVVIDYMWGGPAEAFLAAITRREFAVIQSETRFVQVGESAAPTSTLPAAVLRSTALTIFGNCGNSSSRRFGRSLSLSDGLCRKRGASYRHGKVSALGIDFGRTADYGLPWSKSQGKVCPLSRRDCQIRLTLKL